MVILKDQVSVNNTEDPELFETVDLTGEFEVANLKCPKLDYLGNSKTAIPTTITVNFDWSEDEDDGEQDIFKVHVKISKSKSDNSTSIFGTFLKCYHWI